MVIHITGKHLVVKTIILLMDGKKLGKNPLVKSSAMNVRVNK